MNAGPVYILSGRRYTTVRGLSMALFKDCHCVTHSMVSADRVITCWSDAAATNVVARYRVSPPKLGEPMTVTRIKEAA